MIGPGSILMYAGAFGFGWFLSAWHGREPGAGQTCLVCLAVAIGGIVLRCLGVD